MLKTLKTECHFFHKEPNYQLKMFLLNFGLNKVAKNTKMYQIFAYFSFYYCKSLSNTFLSARGSPERFLILLRFSHLGVFLEFFFLF